MPKVFQPTKSTFLKPYWKAKDNSLKLYHGDVIEVLNKLPEQSVQMCVTSPPYYGLRCYDGTATWEGGDESCDHVIDKRSDPSRLKSKDGHAPVAGCPTRDTTQVAKSHCGKCGAKRIDKQIGSEETIDQFVEKMVEVFRAVKRVLRDDGTCWINLGDNWDNGVCQLGPHRVAITLGDDGWVIRQDIVWCLSGGTWVYARTKKGDMPIMIRDLFRLKTGTFSLWDGEKWTRVNGMTKSPPLYLVINN